MLGEMSFQPQLSLQGSNSKTASLSSSNHALHSTLASQCRERSTPTVSMNSQRPSMPVNAVSDPQNIMES